MSEKPHPVDWSEFMGTVADLPEEPLTEATLLEAFREFKFMKQVEGVRTMVRDMIGSGGGYEFHESTYLPDSENVYVLRSDNPWSLEDRVDLCVVHPPGLREKAVELMAMVEESARSPNTETEEHNDG